MLYEVITSAEFPAFHWHGETFSLPPGATWIAESAACAHQAFEIPGRIVGLQFHLETTLESMEALIENCSDELCPGMAHVQSAQGMRQRVESAARARVFLDMLLKRMLA